MKLPVCFESKSTATAFRSLLDELGYHYKRTNLNRSYSGVAIVIAIERVAMVYRYEIEEINGYIGFNDLSLVAVRCYVKSPFDNENAIYYGGFDPNGFSSINSRSLQVSFSSPIAERYP